MDPQQIIRSIYISNVFTNPQKVEEYYFNLFIAKKENIVMNTTFIILVNISGYHSSEYIFNKEVIDNKIKLILITIYFYLFKSRVKCLLSHLTRENEMETNKDILRNIASLYSNEYLEKYVFMIKDDFNVFMDETTQDILKIKFIPLSMRYHFIYKIMNYHTNIQNYLYHELIDFLYDKNDNTQLLSEDKFQHCLYILKSKKKFNINQRRVIFDGFKKKIIVKHYMLFKIFCAFYSNKKLAFVEYTRHIKHIIMNFSLYKADFSNNDNNLEKMIYKMITKCIIYNENRLFSVYINNINDILIVVYENVFFFSSDFFNGIMNVYLKFSNNFGEFINRIARCDTVNMNINHHILRKINNFFILSKKENLKIKTLLSIY